MATLVKASFSVVGRCKELSNMAWLQCHRPLTLALSPEYWGEGNRCVRWWDAAGMFAIVQLFNYKCFKHSTFDRRQSCSADE